MNQRQSNAICSRRASISLLFGCAVFAWLVSQPLLAAGLYRVTLNPLPGKATCVAEPVQITGSYEVATTDPDDIAPLAPLSAPTLDVMAAQGKIDIVAKEMKPAGGKFILLYRSQSAGVDVVEVVVAGGGEVLGRKTLRLKAKKPCKLSYRLNAELLARAASGPFAIHQKITLKTAGILQGEAWDQPFSQVIGGGSGLIRMTHEVPLFKAPGCGHWTTKPGKGMGFVVARSPGSSDDKAFKITFDRPEEFREDMNMEVTCDGKTARVANFFDLLAQIPEVGNWIEADLPSELGKHPVHIDLLDLMKSRLEQGQGTEVDYSATLDVRKQ